MNKTTFDLFEEWAYRMLGEWGRSKLVGLLWKLFPMMCRAELTLWSLDYFDDYRRLFGWQGVNLCMGPKCDACSRWERGQGPKGWKPVVYTAVKQN